MNKLFSVLGAERNQLKLRYGGVVGPSDPDDPHFSERGARSQLFQSASTVSKRKETENIVPTVKAEEKKDRKSGSGNSSNGVICKVCGHQHGGECHLKNHPDANLSALPWKDSDMGKKWKANGQERLNRKTRADGTKIPENQILQVPKRQRRKKPRRGMEDSDDDDCLCELCNTSMQYIVPEEISQIIPMIIYAPNNLHTSINILLDTGALKGNFVDLATANWLISNGAVVGDGKRQICGALSSDTCSNSRGSIGIKLLINSVPKNQILYGLHVNNQSGLVSSSTNFPTTLNDATDT